MDAGLIKTAAMSGLGIACTAATGWLGVWAYKRRVAVDADKKKDEAPIDILKSTLDKAWAEIAAGRAQTNLIMTNHLAHDSQDRAKLIEVLTRMEETMSAMKDAMAAQAGVTRNAFEALHSEIIELRVGIAEKFGNAP